MNYKKEGFCCKNIGFQFVLLSAKCYMICYNVIIIYIVLSNTFNHWLMGGRRGRDHTVVGFTYHH